MLTTTDKAEIRRIFREVVRKELVDMIREELEAQNSDMAPIEKICEIYGWSKDFMARKVYELGGVKAGGKWFFSRRAVDEAIRTGRIRTSRESRMDLAELKAARAAAQ